MEGSGGDVESNRWSIVMKEPKVWASSRVGLDAEID